MLFLDGTLTNREMFNGNGTLSDKRIEYLLDLEDEHEKFVDTAENIREAKSQFPDEDFLSDIKGKLITLSKHLRGSNRTTLTELIINLEEAIDEQVRASEYGMEELNKALKIIEG